MTLFEELLQNETLKSVRERIVTIAQASTLSITNWITGGTGEQTLQTFALATYQKSLVISQTIRGLASLDTSTDPGDFDPYDPNNETLPPEPGFLSAKGENDFGTPRREATFASGFVTFTNAGPVARTFGPSSLTFTWTASPPDPAPTYRNAPDPSIYTDPGGTVTVSAGTSISLPIYAEEVGTRSNAPPNALSLTTVLGGCSATNPSPIVGTDRESAEDYRERCRQAPSRVSLGGPTAAYEYLAQTKLDGSPLVNASGNPVGITRVQVTQESDDGTVEAYYATGAGAATSEDVDAANDNIERQAFAVPDAITFTGQAATEVPVSVAGTVNVPEGPGVTEAVVRAAIVAALAEYFRTFKVGGLDRVGNLGRLYTSDLQATAAKAFPGLYAVAITTPFDASTILATGEVPVLVTDVTDWTVTIK